MTGLTKLAAVAVVAFLTAAAVVADGDGTSGGQEFDWLAATNGRAVFRDGFATADSAEVAGFVATGINPKTITLMIGDAGYYAVLRGGRYYSNEENPDDSRDIPASAEVLGEDGRRLFAAKGYKFMKAFMDATTGADDGVIVIRHWRGVMGCGLADYHLSPSGTNLTITKTQIISTKDDSPCKTE